ncbi:MAG: IS4 family transposase [Myxococcaceae bacterium]|nr:MAG: IS4 family transposase [Myxococcaceae bacterium]
MLHADAASVAFAEFAAADLGHKARTKRAVQVAEAMLRCPGDSLSTACETWAQAKAGYRLLRHRRVTPAQLLSGHVQATVARCSSADVLLLLQDTCEADFSSRTSTSGLGQIGNEAGRGFLFHTTLAVAAGATFDVLGVVDQQVWARSDDKPSRRSQKLTSAQRKKLDDLESRKWEQGARAAHQQLQSTRARRIHVGDRESDVFEFFEAIDALGDSCVLRVKTARCLTCEPVRQARAKNLPGVYPKLTTAMVWAPVVFTKTVNVPARPQHAARQAMVEVRAATVSIEPPQERSPRGNAMVRNVVWVIEPEPPQGEEAVSWFLLTKEPIETSEQVAFIVRCYEARWLIEEFHMGVKTGAGLEKSQLESAHALMNYLSLASVVAWHLLVLRDTARRAVPVPAGEVLTETQLEVLHGLRPKLRRGCSSYEALRTIATLGGFLARKSDGEPGWRTLWKGFRRLLHAEQGYLLALRRQLPALTEVATGWVLRVG